MENQDLENPVDPSFVQEEMGGKFWSLIKIPWHEIVVKVRQPIIISELCELVCLDKSD